MISDHEISGCYKIVCSCRHLRVVKGTQAVTLYFLCFLFTWHHVYATKCAACKDCLKLNQSKAYTYMLFIMYELVWCSAQRHQLKHEKSNVSATESSSQFITLQAGLHRVNRLVRINIWSLWHPLVKQFDKAHPTSQSCLFLGEKPGCPGMFICFPPPLCD